MAVLGLDIGSDTIKVVEMSGGRGHLRVTNYGIASTPTGAVAGGDVQDVDAVGEAVRALIKLRKFKANKVISSVQSQQSVVVRIIEMPRMSDKELEESMRFEVEKHIPFSASHFIMDYRPIERPGEPTDTPNMEVLFAAAAESMIDDHVATLKAARLKPVAIDVQPLALSHSLVEGSRGDGGLGRTVAVVNIGANGTDLCIIKDGLLHFPRSIPIGGRSITQRIDEGLGVGEHQAEVLKRRHGSMRPLPPELAAHLAAPAAAAAEAAPAPASLDFAADDLFTLESDDSDMGFGGTGTVHASLTFGQPEPVGGPPEVVFDDTPSDTMVGLDMGGAGGPVFDFGGPAPAAAPSAPPSLPAGGGVESTFDFAGDVGATPSVTAATEASDPSSVSGSGHPSGDDEVSFDFVLDEPHEDLGGADVESTFDFGAPAAPSAPNAPKKAAAKPAAPSGDETTFDFGFGDPEPPAKDKGKGKGDGTDMHFDLAPDDDHDKPHAKAAPSDEHDFDFGEPAAGGSAEISGTGSAPGGEHAAEGSFDFDFGEAAPAGSSLQHGAGAGAARPDRAGATEVGSSYDLDFLGGGPSLSSDTGELDLSLESAPSAVLESTGFDLDDDLPSTAGAHAAAASAPGELHVLTPEDEEYLRVREVMEPVVRDLAQEVARSLEYYRSRYEGAVVDRVVLVGGSARIDGLAEFFEEELGLPVECGNPLDEVTVSNSRLTPEDIERDAPLLAVAVGLAMRGLMS
jgi:type IV pilus assembly protein PilM